MWLTPEELERFFRKNDYKEEAMREIFMETNFTIFSWAFMRMALDHKKLSIDFIRELKNLTKMNWEYFMEEYKDQYTYKELEDLQKEFKLTNEYGYWKEQE